MPEVNIKNDICETLAEILETNPGDIDPKASFVDDLGMDSMMALEILASIEKRYKIVIPEEKLPQFTSLDKTVEVVSQILSESKTQE
jgi:acyl carrier protein